MAPQQSTLRSANACERCRRRKVKCSGESPCNGCRRHRAPCIFPTRMRGRYTEEQMQALQSKVDEYERQIQNLESSQAAQGSLRNSHDNDARNAAPLTTGSVPDQPQSSPAPPAERVTTSTATDPTERARGPAYESRVRYLLDRSHGQIEPSPPQVQQTAVENRQNSQALALQTPAQSLQKWLDDAPRCTIPSEPESRRLLELFLSHLGVNQHFFDPRTFADTMITLYQGQSARQATMRTAWYIEYLLVMAMASLMDFDTISAETHRGFDFFAEAMRILPPMHRFNVPDILVVEILMLIAVYLQWRNRKPDAYLYIGYAVRQAIGKGCTLAEPPRGCLPSEEAHRVRVWWTAFMLDRRLSADLGLPSSADDRQFSVPLPSPTPGFPSPEALIINIEIARVTGNIMTYLYSDAEITSHELVQNIQRFLNRLYEIGRSIPVEYTIDVAHPSPGVTRTGGSLYLNLYQAIILCARPILLQRVREKVSALDNVESVDVSTDLVTRLCITCKQSAINSVRILYGLRKKEQIARFGFFDLEAAFSAALTLIMSGFIENTSLHNMMPELPQAVEVLHYLSKAGNKAAEQRLADIDQFASRVWTASPAISSTMIRDINVTNTEDVNIRGPEETGQGSQMTPGNRNLSVPRSEAYNNVDMDSSFVQPDQSFFGHAADFQQGFNFDMDLNPDTDLIFDSFNDPNMPLTGVDELDWAEIERIFKVQET